MTEVKEDQFDVEGDCVVHRPTNAEFYSYRGIKDCEWINWGNAGNVLPNGSDFDRRDLMKVASKLLATRPTLKK
jgi:hypothetical protein